MSSQTVYLVTGSNRGIGLELVTQLVANPSNLVYGTARNLAGAESFKTLAAKFPNFKPLEADVVKPETLANAAKIIASEIGYIDVVLANAGIFQGAGPVKDLDLDLLHNQFEVNTRGSVATYQAFRELLLKSKQKKLVFTSTLLGSVSGFVPAPTAAYGSSKAALNLLARSIAVESNDEGLIVLSLHPGLVATDMTDMANGGVNFDSFGVTLISPEESVTGILHQVENVTKSDQFLDYRGETLPW